MKKLLFLLVFIPLVSFGQSKKEIIEQLEKSRSIDNQRIIELQNQNKLLVNENNLLKEKLKKGTFDTPENFAKSFFKLLKNKNLSEASKLLLNINDSIYFSDKLNEAIKEAAKEDSITIKEFFQEFNNASKESFDEVYYEGLNMGINWQNAIFEKATFNIEFEDDIDHYGMDDLKVFFKSSNKEYSFRIRRVFIINEKLYNWDLRGGIVDIQTEKEEKEKKEKEAEERKKQREIELEKKPYVPYGFKIGKNSWRWNKEKRPQTFSSFYLKFTNDTEHIIDEVKFQLSIYTGSYNSDYKVFGKTITYVKGQGLRNNSGFIYFNLDPGDVLEIEIEELSGFFLGEDIDGSKWRYKVKILEVFPKHNN